MHSCLCLRSLLSKDESMFDSGSMGGSHVFSEAQSLSHFSKALTAEVETVLSHDGPALAASLAGPAAFAEFSLFLLLDLGHGNYQLTTCVLKLLCMNTIASSLVM